MTWVINIADGKALKTLHTVKTNVNNIQYVESL